MSPNDSVDRDAKSGTSALRYGAGMCKTGVEMSPVYDGFEPCIHKIPAKRPKDVLPRY